MSKTLTELSENFEVLRVLAIGFAFPKRNYFREI